MKCLNRRKYDRVSLDLSVRFITRKDMESCGRLIDVSEGGLSMITSAKANLGDEIIVYPEGLGRLTGRVRRKTVDGLAIEFDITNNQRSHLKKRIHSAVHGVPYVRLLENRTHRRLNVNLASKARQTPCGKPFDCEIVDLSETGALIKSEQRPNVGAEVVIGSMKGAVRRHTINGFALEFSMPYDTMRVCA